MSDNLGHRAARGTIWSGIDRFSIMGITFVVNLIMARILSVEDYGLVIVISLFTNISTILVDGGFGNAIIHKKDTTQTDLSTVFFWNLGLGIMLYGVLYACAPPISRFFREPELVGVTRSIGLIVVFNSLVITQISRLRKKLAFKTLAIVNICAAVGGGVTGIVLSVRGHGVYSLVWLQVTTCALQFMLVSIAGRWLPSLIFSAKTFKELFGYGGYLLAANVLQVFCSNIQNVIIGRKFSVTQSGLYSQAQKIDVIVSQQIPQVLVQVMFPVYSQLQDDDARLRKTLAMNMRIIAFAMFPLIMLLIMLAEPVFGALYGDRWLGSGPYIQVLCCGGFFVTLQNINFYAVAAKGKSRTLLHWSYYKWGMLLALIAIGVNFGVFGLLWGIALSNFNIFVVNAALASKYVGFKLRTQAAILMPLFALTGFSAATSLLCVTAFNLNCWLTIPIFAVSYLLPAYSLRMKALHDTLEAIGKLKRPTG